MYALAAGLFFYIQAVRHSDTELLDMIMSHKSALNSIAKSASHYQSAAQRLPEAEASLFIDQLAETSQLAFGEVRKFMSFYESFWVFEEGIIQGIYHDLARRFRFVITKDQLLKKLDVKDDLMKRLEAVQRKCVPDPVLYSTPRVRKKRC